jgi:hypothetical protein
MAHSLLNHLELDDKIELCDTLFKNRFCNEFFRRRSFQMCNRLKPYTNQLASLGYFYSGRQVHRNTVTKTFDSFLFITCVFCKYTYRIDAAQCGEGNHFNFEDLKQSHERFSTSQNRCRMQFLNIPIRTGLEVFNVHQVEYTPILGNVIMEKLEIQPLLSTTECNDPKNKWVICMVCRERAIGVAFLPCGCANLCSSCVRDYNSKHCSKCNAEIKGYSKIIIT